MLLISESVKQNTHMIVIPSMTPRRISFAVALYTLGSSFMSIARFNAVVIDSIVITKSTKRNLWEDQNILNMYNGQLQQH